MRFAGRRRVLWAGLRLLLGATLVGYLIWSDLLDWSALAGLFRRWRLTALALALTFLNVALVSYRLCVLMRARGFGLSLAASIRLNLLGMFFNVFLPGFSGGDAVRIYFAVEGMEGRRAEVATILLFDRVVGLLALMMLPMLVLPFFPDLARLAAVGQVVVAGFALAVLVTAGGAVLCLTPLLARPIQRIGLFAPGRRGHLLRRMYEAIHGYRSSLMALARALGVALVSQAAALAILSLALEAVHPGAWRAELLLLAPAGFLANVVPLTPGGLGVGEAAMEQLFAIGHMEGGAEALLGFRLIVLLVSLAGLPVFLAGRRRVVGADESA